MKYIYNNNREFCGLCFFNCDDGTDIPIKPLRQGEKAIWNGEKWEYDFLDEENLISNEVLDEIRQLFSESRQRDPLGVYNEESKEDFIVIGDKEVSEELENRTFDCVFLGRINFNSFEDLFSQKNMVLRKEIWEEVKEMNELCRIKTLFSKYACFIFSGEWQDGEKASEDEFLDIVAYDERVWKDYIPENGLRKAILDIVFFANSRIWPGGGSKTLPKEDKITILIPCYGKKNYILETVKTAVNQTMLPYKVKVLLMDDESIALKSEIEALSPLVECEVHERLNASAARNYLVNQCETEYFILLDADDTIDENFVEEVYKMDASIVFPGWIEESFPNWEYYNGGGNVFRECITQNLTALLCKTVWEEVGGLDEELCEGGEDADFTLRLFCETKWKIQKTLKTNIHYKRNTENSLAVKDEFFSSHFKWLIKNKEIIRREMKKSRYLEDNFTKFFSDDFNFKSEKRCALKFVKNLGDFMKLTLPCQFVTFELKKGECNRKCDYCNQAKPFPYPSYSDDETFERFDKLLSKVEEITGGVFHVQITGGEPTLWSDYLIQKILDRLKDKQEIMVMTNHDKKDSLWESDSRIHFYTHLCDWQNMGKIDVQTNEQYMIVVCHDDIQFLEDFIKKNKYTAIAVDEYIGEDEDKKLTDEDRLTLASLAKEYPAFDRKWLFFPNEYKSSSEEEIKECREKKNVWRADCANMTFCPCCGRYQSLILCDDFTGQKPNLEECEGCTVINRF